MINKNRKGFTLVELLVVISIISLLSTFAVIGLSSARKKGRDAKRLADIKQIQTALEFYFSDNNGYPPAATPMVLGTKLSPGATLCSDGFLDKPATCTSADQIYMAQVPGNPIPGGIPYSYSALPVGTDPPTTYSLTFQLEGNVGNIVAGAPATATPAGITQ